MTSCSSTSASKRLGRAFPAVFFAAVALGVALVNQGLLRAYARVDGRFFNRAWVEQKDAYAAASRARALNSVYVGDSTVEAGVAMDLVDRGGFSLARSGFEPSRLPSAADLLLADAARRPRYVLLTLTSSHLSEDAWARPSDVPLGPELADAARLYYSDGNSFKPLLCGGCSYLTTAAEKAVGAVEAALTPAPASPAPAWTQAAAAADLKLRRRETNFRLVEDFKRRLEAAGVRVIWVYLPARKSYLESLASGPGSRDFARLEEERVAALFGPDVVDLRGGLPDDDFLDDVHANAAGAPAQSRLLGRALAARYPGFVPGAAPVAASR